MRISDKAFDLIVSEEVTSKTHYEAKLRRTEWPGEASGVTVGIGYDLGQTDSAKIREDWDGRVPAAMLSSMLSASGVTGNAAGSLATRLKANIDIPWDVALAVHRECVVPRWERTVEKALPNTDELSPDCFGALVSLTFNRGASFSNEGDRYREMRAIKAHMAAGAFDRIPAEIRAMKRIWRDKGLDGLLRRRDAEADLFQRGLSAPRPSAARPSVPGPTPTAPGPTTPRAAGSDLPHLVIAAMERKGYQVDRGPGEVNIVYVEGMSADGTANGDEANKWNDLRLLIKFEGGEPRIVGSWAATTEPGRYWTQNPMSPLGAARIEFGQYKSWQVGMHRGNHEALVQTGGKVTVCRDLNKDGLRTGDTRQTGEFGINQHWGYDLPEVEKASAGCLVGQSKNGHREFMAIVKSDPRYRANRKHVFATAILPESDVLAEGSATLEPPVEPGVDHLLPPLAPPDVSEEVRRWQKLLGFSEEEQDGIFGAITEEAVKRLQRRHGLTITGDVDEKTRDALEREAADASGGPPTIVSPREVVKPPEGARPIELGVKRILPDVLPRIVPLALGVGAVNPLIALAAGVLPDILKAVVGDKAGTVAGAVKNAVTEITRTENPEEAKQKLETDPAAVAALQLKLAEIAAEQEEKRQQAQLALLKEQNEQEAKRQQAQMAVLKEQNEQEVKRREAQLTQFRAEIEDTRDARSTFSKLALAHSPMQWGAPAVSVIVTLGFFGILILLVVRGIAPGDQVAQIINITVGALAAAFATVVSFWLGSSQGSRNKDAATTAAIETQVKQTEALQSSMQAQAKQAEALRSTMKTAIAAKPAVAAPKPSNFRRCLDIVLGYEGGFSAEPGDPSGATQFGIGIGALRDFRGDESLGVEDLKNLGRDEACEIYRTRYWNVLRCDDLPTGVDLVVFDFAVDANTGRAARTLQQVVGAEADGSIGDATLAATKVKPARDVVKEMSGRRLEYYRALPDAAGFIRGAIDRANAVEKAALDMIPAERPAAVA